MMTTTEKKEQIRNVIRESNLRWDADPIYLHYDEVTTDVLASQKKPMFFVLVNGIQGGDVTLEGYRNDFYDISIQGNLPLGDKAGKSQDDRIVRFETKMTDMMTYLQNYRTPYPEDRTLEILSRSVRSGRLVSVDGVYVYEYRFFTQAY